MPTTQAACCSYCLPESHCRSYMCVGVWQAAQVWGEEEKATLRRRERQVQEAEERADNLLQSAAAEVDRQSQALEEERRILKQHRHASEQVNTSSPVFMHAHMHFPDYVLSTRACQIPQAVLPAKVLPGGRVQGGAGSMSRSVHSIQQGPAG